ncbi:hypothetical protein K437DRAFT_44621 [Tilletiaria anomala UBC 951]|uniref:Velvet domain-containing protein n=1 Tax=Tilletiaria anomala (strain ATCC 24038 / CBS 436.72 / UBC 951) TaxID=1037660 RepID=A0A066WHJ1_TILAU|nr:uncharacterized protein K437DRAFT_44621 [Tilletiaria anomala UBC 951]KDN51983.1 hypothetical protein K437DRAFT_44621 [Tilletiaria anomala UBC 951]
MVLMALADYHSQTAIASGIPIASGAQDGPVPPSASTSIGGYAGERDGKQYTLHIEQSPNRARVCAFGDKDRRPLSPALVVKLTVRATASGSELNPTSFDTSLFVLTADLVDATTLAPRSLFITRAAALLDSNPSASPRGGAGGSSSAGAPSNALMTTSSVTRNLIGNPVCSANTARNLQEELCIFFVMQDISVRMEGEYRLKLSFTSLDAAGRISEGMSLMLAEIYTAPFTCYPPRKFPGQVAPTPLSRKLASQGIKLAIRTDHKKSAGVAAGADDEEDD